MGTRLTQYLATPAAPAIDRLTLEQLDLLDQSAHMLLQEARVAALESDVNDCHMSEVYGMITTLEGIVGCVQALQAHPASRPVLESIHQLLAGQQERLGLMSETPALESVEDNDLTVAMESAIWDTIKRLWAALVAMCKKLVGYIVNLFKGHDAQQKALAARIEAVAIDIKDAEMPATEDAQSAYGVLVDASAQMKDALNIQPRVNRIDLKGMLSDGIADIHSLSQLKDRLYHGLQLLEKFGKDDQASLETAILAYVGEFTSTTMLGYRGPLKEDTSIQYHSKWLHPRGGIRVVLPKPSEVPFAGSEHRWAATTAFGHLTQGLSVSYYRDEPLPDREGTPLRLTKPEMMAFFAEVREFARAASAYGAVYKAMFEGFDHAQTAAIKPFADKVNGAGDAWSDVKDSPEKKADYQMNNNACLFITHVVQVAQRYARLADLTSSAHTEVLSAASHLTHTLADKILHKKKD